MEAVHSNFGTKMKSVGLSHVGNVRQTNEDSIYEHMTPPCYVVVADGMGGHAAGEVASSTAVQSIREYLEGCATRTLDGDQIIDAVQHANSRILEEMQKTPEYEGMGTTLTFAYLEPTCVTVAHVGDSSAYLEHAGQLVKITRDHTYVQKLIDCGIFKGDVAQFPYRNVITRALGMPEVKIDLYRVMWEPGDRLLLCSDGLTTYAAPDRLLAELTQDTTIERQAQSLLDYALAEGGKDNISLIIVNNPLPEKAGA